MCEDTTSEVFSIAFLDSYVCVLHLTVIVNTASFLLCVWLILCKSTKEMFVYRWFLLNQWIIWIVLMTATSVSILQSLCYRYLAIRGNEDWILKTYSIILMVTVQFCYSLPHLLFKMFTLLSEEESIDFILNVSGILLFLSFPLSSCHTTFSSLTLIILIRPYRRVVTAKISTLCHLFGFIKQKSDAVVLYNGSGIVNGEVDRVSPKRGSVNAAPTRQSLVPTTEKMLDSPAQLSYCARYFTCWWTIIMGVLGVFGIVSIVLTYLSQSSSSYYKSQQ
ncbi:hypothetical protein Ddc_22216 [Ditylenchus destructor]|nr:hypothetical protein Ddc_22216 [Ditylenchus destructor]